MSVLTPDDVLLGLLAAAPAHGYQLLAVFRDPAALGAVWHLSTSQLYAVLKRLEREGLIDGVARESHDAPPRVEYMLTEVGRERLLAWLHDPAPSADVAAVRIMFLCRLFVARLLGLPTGDIVRRQAQALRARRDKLLAAQTGDAPGIAWLSRQYDIEQLQAVLRWIERTELVARPDVLENEG